MQVSVISNGLGELVRGKLPLFINCTTSGIVMKYDGVNLQAASHKSYPWEYWPREEGRSECDHVGLLNLGATCYMATAVQQLFMIPATR